MNYSKPEVKTLGDATIVIETSMLKPIHLVMDGSMRIPPLGP